MTSAQLSSSRASDTLVERQEEAMPISVPEPQDSHKGVAGHSPTAPSHPRSPVASVDTGALVTAPQEHPPPIKDYGEPWEWDPVEQDYARVGKAEGVKILYTDYQKKASIAQQSPTDADHYTHLPESNGDSESQAGRGTPPPRTASIPKIAQPPAPDTPLYEQPLGSEFQVVTKPKRFFCVGRIFKAVWFEPATTDALRRHAANPDSWPSKCPPFHGEKPVARFRWFIVVRRRLHHSLCFSITTFGGKHAANKTNRGRSTDYVVLHNANVEPARPDEEEGITREPVAIIIEDEEQYIAPIARLDCGRIYTVEDNIKVAKIGRVHPTSLVKLEEYYRESVL